MPIVAKRFHRLNRSLDSSSATHRYCRPPVSNKQQHQKLIDEILLVCVQYDMCQSVHSCHLMYPCRNDVVLPRQRARAVQSKFRPNGSNMHRYEASLSVTRSKAALYEALKHGWMHEMVEIVKAL